MSAAMRTGAVARLANGVRLLRQATVPNQVLPNAAVAAAAVRAAHVYAGSYALPAATPAAYARQFRADIAAPTTALHHVSMPQPSAYGVPTIMMHPSSPSEQCDDVPSQFAKAAPLSASQLHHTSSIRVHLRPRMAAGVTKRRSVRRALSTSSSSSSSPSSSPSPSPSPPHNSNANNGRLAFRDTLRSPRKAVAYVKQSGSDLADWGRHMWAGVKLLAADVRVSWKVLSKISHGKAITRRERNFAVQTGVDLARLVPFSLFLIIPLAEFALPFALRLFPNMLPSQFQSKMQKEENMKRQLKANLELAKFVRDIVEEKVKAIRSSDKDSTIKNEASQLADFLEAIRSGKAVDVSEVSRFARLFNDELTLEGAVRPQLVAMCKYMGITAHGPDHLLRFRLRSRLNSIKNDDMVITWEGGSDSLTDDEVAKACRDRGIRMVGVSNYHLRAQLSDWLEMSQDKAVPASLMIMSRAFLYTGEDALKETLSSLTDEVYDDVKMAAEIGDGSNIDRLEEARRQGKLIDMESEREARKDKEAAEKKKRQEEESAAAADGSTISVDASIVSAMPSIQASMSDAAATASVVKHEAKLVAEKVGTTPDASTAVSPDGSSVSVPGAERVDRLPDASMPSEMTRPSEEVSATNDVVRDEDKSEEELAKDREAIIRVVDAIGALSSESAVEAERLELESLKDELAEAESVLQSLGGGNESELRRFKKMVVKLEKQIEVVDGKLGASMKLLDLDNDGVLSMNECMEAVKLLAGSENEAVATETLRRLDADADGNISKQDLHRLVRELHDESGGLIDDIQNVQERLQAQQWKKEQ
jgi:LETM1 and EF-hand domain-containing protein 1, mitochondrial